MKSDSYTIWIRFLKVHTERSSAACSMSICLVESITSAKDAGVGSPPCVTSDCKVASEFCKSQPWIPAAELLPWPLTAKFKFNHHNMPATDNAKSVNNVKEKNTNHCHQIHVSYSANTETKLSKNQESPATPNMKMW